MLKNKIGGHPARAVSPQRRIKSLMESVIASAADEMSSNRKRRNAFLRIVARIRSDSNLLKPSRLYGWRACQHIQNVVQLCANIAEYNARWIRNPDDWTVPHLLHGGGVSQNAPQLSVSSLPKVESSSSEIASLLNHLFVRNSVPKFLFRYWFGEVDQESRDGRNLFVHLAAGHSIRGSKLGEGLDRKMAKRFLQAKDHMTLGEAIQFARDGKPAQPVECFPAGVSRRRRKIRRIHQSRSADDTWRPVPIGDFYHTESVCDLYCQRRTWIIRQLTSRRELEAEGFRLRHCVGCYWWCCMQRESSIWTMESRDIFRTRSLLTIEVDPRKNEIVQIKGFCNRGPRKHEMRLILFWAAQESLRMRV